MDISLKSYSTSFSSRYLRIPKPDEFPKEVYNAIYKSDGIDAFLHPNRGKSAWQKFKDLFREDEFLDIYYRTDPKKGSIDPYEQTDSVLFALRKVNGEEKFYPMEGEVQQGIKRPQGVIPKPGEHRTFKPPVVTAAVKLANKIMDLKLTEAMFK